MTTEGEVIDVGLLSSQIEDSDLGVGNTTVVSGLWEPRGICISIGLVIVVEYTEMVCVENRRLTACSCSIGSTSQDVDPS